MSGALDGRTVLITGAGAGLGRGVALAAAGAGAHVIVTSLGENGGATAAEITSRGGSASWVTCDVTDRAAVERAVATAVGETGRLDGVVHNALARPEWDQPGADRIESLPPDLWEHQARVAVRGAYYCATSSLEQLAAHRGRLILLSSAAGLEGSPVQPAYAACKGALRGLTKSLAREWGPLGVTVNAVSPFVTTPSFEKWWKADPGAKDATLRLTALGTLGEPEADVAPVFVFLLSDASHYVTGQTFAVDAGRYLSL